jgi:hypothetical protein
MFPDFVVLEAPGQEESHLDLPLAKPEDLQGFPHLPLFVWRADADGIKKTVFVHSSLSETFFEAALATDGEAIHVLQEVNFSFSATVAWRELIVHYL